MTKKITFAAQNHVAAIKAYKQRIKSNKDCPKDRKYK